MCTLRGSISRSPFVAATVTVVLMLMPSNGRADDPVSSSVRFNREIIRILQRRCAACHAPGRLSLPLLSYRDVREWGRAIREEVVEQRMPPSTAAPGYGHFENALGMTFRETTTLLSWLDGGMPRGDDRDLPERLDPFETPPASTADLVVDLPEQSIPALEELVVRRVTVPTGLTRNRRLARLVLRPGDRTRLRGALLFAGADAAEWMGAWLPWQHTLAAPPGHAFDLPRATPLTVLLYYRGGDEAAVDRSKVELHFAPDAETSVRTVRIEAVSGRGTTTLATHTTLWAVQTLTAPETRTLELRATRPDGSIEVLLWEPVTRPEWPDALLLQRPVTLPAKTTLTLLTSGTGEQRRETVSLSSWPATTPRK